MASTRVQEFHETVAFECAALPVEIGADVVEQRAKARVVAHRIEFCEGYSDEILSVRVGGRRAPTILESDSPLGQRFVVPALEEIDAGEQIGETGASRRFIQPQQELLAFPEQLLGARVVAAARQRGTDPHGSIDVVGIDLGRILEQLGFELRFALEYRVIIARFEVEVKDQLSSKTGDLSAKLPENRLGLRQLAAPEVDEALDEFGA
jgi:hypothetical protein